MTRVLVLGGGLQGQAVLHDLALHSDAEILVADVESDRVAARLSEAARGRVKVVDLDATRAGALTALLDSSRPAVVICMLPPALQVAAASAALAAGAHFVSSSYPGELSRLDEEARRRELLLLPELGLDPGIDLALCRLAVDELDQVQGLESYGAGLPEPACAGTSPLRYKITWTFEGVLGAYLRPARLRRGGEDRSIAPEQMFHPDEVHLEQVEGVGELEAYPNGDALAYVEPFGLGPGLLDMGRFGLRYPGHCAFWYTMAQLGLLDPTPLEGVGCSPRSVLARVMAPKLQFARHERDLVILRVRARGLRGDEEVEVVYDLLDYRDLETGLFAMNRTVGFTSSVGAQLVIAGAVAGRGLLSPARDVPPRALLEALAERGIVSRRSERRLGPRPGRDLADRQGEGGGER